MTGATITLFFGAIHKLETLLDPAQAHPEVVILELHHLVNLDTTNKNLKTHLSPETTAPHVDDTVDAQMLNAHTCCYDTNEELLA